MTPHCFPTTRSNFQEMGAVLQCSATITRHTNQNEPTIAYRKGTGSPSTAEDTRDTRLRYRRCSTNAHRCKPTGRPCEETSHTMDSGCVGRTHRRPCRARGRAQLGVTLGTCSNIMSLSNQERSHHAVPV